MTQYRSIYIGGDVERPGAQAYQPGKSARQALVDAGGFNILRSRVVDPILTHADLQAEREALRLELERLRLARQRVEAELAGQPMPAEGQGTLAAPLSRQELQARLQGRARDRASLAQSQSYLQDRIGFLQEQLDSELGVAKADATNEDRIRLS